MALAETSMQLSEEDRFRRQKSNALENTYSELYQKLSNSQIPNEEKNGIERQLHTISNILEDRAILYDILHGYTYTMLRLLRPWLEKNSLSVEGGENKNG